MTSLNATREENVITTSQLWNAAQPQCLATDQIFCTSIATQSNTKGCTTTAATHHMRPESPTRSWDFSAVLDLLHALSPSDLERPSTPPPIHHIDTPSSLGDFDRLWHYLGKPTDILGSKTNIESSLSDQDLPSTTSSSPPNDIQLEHEYKGKEVRWRDEVDATDLDDSISTYVSKVISKTSSASSRKRSKSRPQPDLTESELEGPPRPRPVNPILWKVPPRLPEIRIDPAIIYPIYTLTEAEKRKKLVKKLLMKYGAEEGSRLAEEGRIPRPMSEWGDNVSGDGIHVFVDCSNIIIGFYDALKAARGINLHAYVKQPPVSFFNLALVLERDRPTARRILLGSTSRSIGGEARLPSYMTEAEYCGYELSILERVMKVKDRTPRKRRTPGTGNGYGTSGQSSGSEAPYYSGTKAVVEQGVDEILHMKFLETLVDYQEPTTIVLASGDGAEAEYSGGFLKNVERALSKGWKVELVSWRENLSQSYRAPAFLKRWKDRFTIVELDDYSEELLAIYVRNHTLP